MWKVTATVLVASALYGLAVDSAAAQSAKVEIIPNIPHSGDVYSAVFSPDGRRVASGSGWDFSDKDNSIKLWDPETGKIYGAVAACNVRRG